MKTLLVLNSSGRVTRSVTRRLTHRFSERWQTGGGGRVVERDLTRLPPPVVDEAWVAAAFREAGEQIPADVEALRVSETLIEELTAADAVIVGVPLYNFGMPAQLKAYFDQIIRVGRTFGLDPSASVPYWGLLSPKPVVVVTSAGDGALLGGGELEHLNFLEPHLTHLLSFIGLGRPAWVRVGYEEFGDDRLRRSIETAEAELDQWADRLLNSGEAVPTR